MMAANILCLHKTYVMVWAPISSFLEKTLITPSLETLLCFTDLSVLQWTNLNQLPQAEAQIMARIS